VYCAWHDEPYLEMKAGWLFWDFSVDSGYFVRPAIKKHISVIVSAHKKTFLHGEAVPSQLLAFSDVSHGTQAESR
jgi:hypothetical protein